MKKLLQELKNKHQISWREVSEKTGVSSATISKYINEEDYDITYSSLFKILMFFQIDLKREAKKHLVPLKHREICDVPIIGQYNVDGHIEPLNYGDPTSIQRHILWEKHKGLLCRVNGYQNWVALFRNEPDHNICGQNIGTTLSVVCTDKHHKYIGLYQYSHQNTQITNFSGNRFDIPEDDFFHVYPVDGVFAPKINHK